MATISSSAARRAVDVLLRGAGARSVMLRTPAPAVAGSASEQLGLAVPQFQDIELSPVVFRTTAAKVAQPELLVSATAVEKLTGSENFAAANTLFASAFGVLIDEALLAIVSITELEAGGRTCGYRLTLRESAVTD